MDKGKMLHFRNENTDDFYIEVERSEEFLKAAKELSEFIKALPLTNEQNDTFIELATRQTLEAEKSGYDFGLKIARTLYGMEEE